MSVFIASFSVATNAKRSPGAGFTHAVDQPPMASHPKTPVGRLGGDEFAVLVPGAWSAPTQALAARR
jgi:predicted signal transduction protein with EAL and GGDEF domain